MNNDGDKFFLNDEQKLGDIKNIVDRIQSQILAYLLWNPGKEVELSWRPLEEGRPTPDLMQATELAQTQAALQEITKEAGEYKAVANRRGNQVLELQRQLEQCVGNCSDLANERDDYLQKARRLENDVCCAQEALIREQENARVNGQYIGRLQAKLADTQDECARWIKEANNLQEVINQANGATAYDNSKLQLELDEANKKLKEANQAWEDMRVTNNQLSKAKNEYQDKCGQLAAALVETKDSLLVVKRDRDKLMREAADWQHRLTKKSEELVQAEARCSTLNAALKNQADSNALLVKRLDHATVQFEQPTRRCITCGVACTNEEVGIKGECKTCQNVPRI